MAVRDDIIALKSSIIDEVAESIKDFERDHQADSYEIVWKQYQDIAAKSIVKIIKENIDDAKVSIPTSKSTYPDIKIEVGEDLFAIDIKCSEVAKNPWYDMARLDTIQEKRLDIYSEEWELLIQYDKATGKFKKSFFGLFREFVGFHNDSQGLKFRPYDGKIRPKTWEEFENNTIFWDTEEKFMQGLRKSIVYRWRHNIQNQLIPILSDEEKSEFSSLFEDD